MIKLALTDMDDTFIAKGNDGASQHAIDAIHAVQEAGLHFGPVSGRQPSAMSWMFGGHAECCATGAFANGEVIMVDGEAVASHPLDNAALMRLAEYLEEETDDTFLKVYDLGSDFMGDGSFCLSQSAERVARAMGGANSWLTGEEAPLQWGLDDTPYYKANIWSTKTPEELVILREQVASEVPELALVFPNNNVSLFDIMPTTWDKGCAALELARILGVKPDEIAAFGDSDNDLAMIRAVENSVAVANANAAVTAAARWHIGAAADDAVADALIEIAACAKVGTMPAFMGGAGVAR